MSNSTNTLTGCSEFTVQKKDGTPEIVKVRQLAIKEFPTYERICSDELQTIDFVCSRNAGFAETLTIESHEGLIAEIERVNGSFFSRWLARQIERQEKIVPGIREKLALATLTSRSSPPKSPSSAA